jgi:hydroxymethylpyrimidine pyrophosphatase-like HAD family hydrolase
MAAYFFDIDGTLVRYHTNEWLPGAKEKLVRLKDEGHQIILMTMRGTQDRKKEWSIEKTKETILADLEALGIDYRILFGTQSPRIMVDDRNCKFIKRRKNESW